jgi:hypothetical protein
MFDQSKVNIEDMADAEEGEFIRDNLIPFSMEYYLKLISSISFKPGMYDESASN